MRAGGVFTLLPRTRVASGQRSSFASRIEITLALISGAGNTLLVREIKKEGIREVQYGDGRSRGTGLILPCLLLAL